MDVTVATKVLNGFVKQAAPGGAMSWLRGMIPNRAGAAAMGKNIIKRLPQELGVWAAGDIAYNNLIKPSLANAGVVEPRRQKVQDDAMSAMSKAPYRDSGQGTAYRKGQLYGGLGGAGMGSLGGAGMGAMLGRRFGKTGLGAGIGALMGGLGGGYAGQRTGGGVADVMTGFGTH